MTVLITGANGCFGRALFKWLTDNVSDEIICSGSFSDLQRERYVTCDVSDRGQVQETIDRIRPRLIYHVAGSFSNAYEKDYAVNSLGAKNIFDSLLDACVEARVVLFGSAAEYGLVDPEDNPIKESQSLRPVSIYGLTKVIQTQFAYFYAHTHGVDAVVARVFNLLMPGLSDRLFIGRVEQMIRKIKAGEAVTMELGNLESYRDYVTGSQALDQVARIASRGIAGEAYNVGSGEPKKIHDVLEHMLSEAGLDWFVVKEQSSGLQRSGYDVPVIYADLSKTNALSGLING